MQARFNQAKISSNIEFTFTWESELKYKLARSHGNINSIFVKLDIRKGGFMGPLHENVFVEKQLFEFFFHFIFYFFRKWQQWGNRSKAVCLHTIPPHLPPEREVAAVEVGDIWVNGK